MSIIPTDAVGTHSRNDPDEQDPPKEEDKAQPKMEENKGGCLSLCMAVVFILLALALMTFVPFTVVNFIFKVLAWALVAIVAVVALFFLYILSC